MPPRRLPRSRSADSPLPTISSGLLPSALFVAVPNTPPPELPQIARDRLSTGLAGTILGSSLLARSLGGGSSPVLAAVPLRARSESDGAVARSRQNNNNNSSSAADDERSPNRTRQSTTSVASSSPAPPSGDRGRTPRLEPDEHHQLREVGRPPEERGSDPDTSLYDYSGAREIEQPRRRPDDDTDDENLDAFGAGEEPESQTESETDYRHPATDGFASDQRLTLTESAVSPLLLSPPSMRSSLNRATDREETLQKAVAGMQQSGPAPDSLEGRTSTPVPSTRRAEPAPPLVEFEEQSDSVNRPTVELRQENKVLKDAVHRLNVELSKYQSKYRPPAAEDRQELGLPTKGPVPSWLINTKYLAPLFLAYDDRIKEKDDMIKQYEDNLLRFQSKVEVVVKENRSLKSRLSTDAVDAEDGRRQRRAAEAGPSITAAEWQPLQKQARLVLQENEVLLEQLRIQDEKLKEACRTHLAEVTLLTKKLATSEASNSSLEAELRHLRVQLNALKAQNEGLASQVKSKVDGVFHQSLIADYNQRIETLKETTSSELEALTAALQAKSTEFADVCRQLSDLQAANKRLAFELGLSEKANRKLQESSEKLQQTLQNVDSKRRSASAILSDVLKAANQTAAERDALVKLALTQKKGELKIWNKMAETELTKEKLAAQIKMSRKELEEQLSAEKEKMKESAREYSARQREYEREIKHLRCLLREKDLELGDAAHDKKHLEEEIELVWQASCRDNRRNEATRCTCSPATCRCSNHRSVHISSYRHISPDHSQD